MLACAPSRRGLDVLAFLLYASGSLAFIASSLLHLAHAPHSANLLRVPASAVLLLGAGAQMAADSIQPSGRRAPHALDWPSAATNVGASALFLAGSITTVCLGPRALAGSLLWLVGSLASCVQTALLLTVEADHAASLRARATRVVDDSRADSRRDSGAGGERAGGSSAARGRLRRWLVRARG